MAQTTPLSLSLSNLSDTHVALPSSSRMSEDELLPPGYFLRSQPPVRGAAPTNHPVATASGSGGHLQVRVFQTQAALAVREAAATWQS